MIKRKIRIKNKNKKRLLKYRNRVEKQIERTIREKQIYIYIVRERSMKREKDRGDISSGITNTWNI
jgi:hypothetical protein